MILLPWTLESKQQRELVDLIRLNFDTIDSLGEQQWDSLVSEHSVSFQIKIGRPKFYAGEMITIVRNKSDRGLA